MDPQKKADLLRTLRIVAMIAAVAVVIKYAVLWRSYSHRSKPHMESIDVRMKKIALMAMSSTELKDRMSYDYSPGSLQKVDEMLERLPQMVSTNNAAEEVAYGCLAWGAYVGEVIRHNHKPTAWSEGIDATGHGIYPLQVGQQTVYPCQWVIDRVEKGPTASVWQRYQAFSKTN